MRKNEDNRKQKVLITVILVLIAVFLVIGICFFLLSNCSKQNAPDYAPHELESNAKLLDDGGDDEKLESPEGGGAVSLSYSKSVTLDKNENTLSLFVGNPEKSNRDIVFEIVYDGRVIARSGRVVPGRGVEKLEIAKSEASRFEEGGYDVTITVYYFDPDSGEKAMVNTEIPAVMTVK